jgi:hypothetical protein
MSYTVQINSTYFAVIAAISLLSLDQTIVSILHQAVAYASSIHNGLDSYKNGGRACFFETLETF